MVKSLGLFACKRENFLDSRSVRDVTDHLCLRVGANVFFDFHADGLEVEAHLLENVYGNSLSEFYQPEQKVFSSHIIMVKPISLLTRKRQYLLCTWSKIVHHCDSDAGSTAFLPDLLLVGGLGKFFNFSRTMSARRWSLSSGASFCFERCCKWAGCVSISS